MALKNALVSTLFALGALAPGMALADHDDDDDGRRGGIRFGAHVHSSSCNHGPAPAGRPSQAGQYELQTVKQWVPGRQEQVWVPERCVEKHKRHGRQIKCKGGYYDQRWIAGYYTTTEQWVWVPAYHHHRRQAPPAPPAYSGHDDGHSHGGARITVSARF